MLTTKEVKIVKNLDIPYKLIQIDDEFKSYRKDYSLNHPSIILKDELEFVENVKLPKTTKHKVVILHNNVMLWCPIFHYFYIKTSSTLGLVLKLSVKLHKGRYTIKFIYHGKKYETKQYKEIQII